VVQVVVVQEMAPEVVGQLVRGMQEVVLVVEMSQVVAVAARVQSVERAMEVMLETVVLVLLHQ